VIVVVRREDVARSVAEAVQAVPGVAGLHPGFDVEVATQYSGGKVVGLSLSGEAVDVYITADRIPFKDVADQAAAAAAVNVVVADVTDAGLNRRSGTRA
jgi:hypothetical protein